MIAVHHALLVFILDGEFDTIKDAVAGIATAPMCCFRLMQRYLKDYFDAFDVKHEHQKDKNQNDLPICLCQRCVKRRISEHMRWNVYMRVNGYKKAIKNRNDLARLHHDLIPWNKLDELEKYKD